MAIVTNVTKRVEIPHEPDQWMEIKKLSWRQLEATKDAQTNALLARMKSLGGDMVKALQGAVEDQKQKPGTQHDRGGVLNCGIVAWSYDVPVTPANVDALDEETAAWAVEEILALNAPRTDEERKNGLSPSTSR